MKIIKQDLEIYICNIKTCSIDWYKDHRLHREDGPAEVWTTGEEYYRLNGRQCLKEEYWKEIRANY